MIIWYLYAFVGAFSTMIPEERAKYAYNFLGIHFLYSDPTIFVVDLMKVSMSRFQLYTKASD